MRPFVDVCASLADVCVVFLTYMCVLTQHMRRFCDIDEFLSYVYITIDTHALSYSSASVMFMMYVLHDPTHMLVFGQICVFFLRIHRN